MMLSSRRPRSIFQAVARMNGRRVDLLKASGDLFDVVQKGVVKLAINQTYPLRDAAQAHRDLQDRKTTGSTVFTV